MLLEEIFRVWRMGSYLLSRAVRYKLLCYLFFVNFQHRNFVRCKNWVWLLSLPLYPHKRWKLNVYCPNLPFRAKDSLPWSGYIWKKRNAQQVLIPTLSQVYFWSHQSAAPFSSVSLTKLSHILLLQPHFGEIFSFVFCSNLSDLALVLLWT